MFPNLSNRWIAYSLLLLLWALLCLPNLGAPALWEIDEGLNSQAGQEMYESGNWIVPSFNSEIRNAKPVLLYWLQMVCYRWLGVSETSARLPSALAGLASILTVCWLGRRLFNPMVGLLAGVILATSVSPCIAAHFANPDALLLLFTLLALACFWYDWTSTGPWRCILGGACTGLAVLAKGPVGLALPLGVIVLFLLWQRRLGWLFRLEQVKGWISFLLTAAPWYVWVALETKGQWLSTFLAKENWACFRTTMENHGGPFWIYLVFLVVGLVPWSIFLGMAVAGVVSRLRREESPNTTIDLSVRDGLRETINQSSDAAALQFLICWFVVVFGFFSLAATKLPNYILPLYPAVALLMARALDDWRRGLSRVRDWEIGVSLVSLGLIGVAVMVGLALVGGVGQAWFLRGHFMPGVARAAWVGLIPLAGAILGLALLRRPSPAGVQFSRGRILAVVAVTASLFLMAAAGWVAPVISRHRAPRDLVALLPADQSFREVRIGTYRYFQPSLVFYCNRRVERFERPEEVRDFLARPLPSYLFLPVPVWEQMQGELGGLARPLGQHGDFYCKHEILVLANRAATSSGQLTANRKE